MIEKQKFKDLLIKNKYPKSIYNDSNYFEKHYKRYLKILTSIEFKSEMNVLDIGSAPGHLSRTLQEYGCNVFNVNLIKDENSNGISTEILNIETESLPYNSNKFDIILFAEILEHLLFNPVPIFKEIYRVLKKDGKVILTTPNACNLINAIHILQCKRVFYDFRDKHYDIPIELWKLYIRHNREYTMQEVCSIFEEVNLNIIKKEYYCSVNNFSFCTLISVFIKKYRNGLFLIGEK